MQTYKHTHTHIPVHRKKRKNESISLYVHIYIYIVTHIKIRMPFGCSTPEQNMSLLDNHAGKTRQTEIYKLFYAPYGCK